MRIGMLLHTEFPPDIRVEKEVDALKRHQEVNVLCVRRKGQPTSETIKGVHVTRVFGRARRARARLSLLARRHSKDWQGQIEQFVLDRKIDVLHVHDLPLLGAAIIVANRFGIKVIADLHENYPAMLATQKAENIGNAFRLSSLRQLLVRSVLSIHKWKEYERAILPKADHVITVVDEAKERLIKLGIADQRQTVVGNYATLDKIVNDEVAGKETDSFNIVYAGGFGSTRDLETVIQAVSKIDHNQNPGIKLLLIGAKGASYNKLKHLASLNNLDDVVQVIRWLPQKDAEKLMTTADVGLVPHIKSPHTDATVPHKLFQYMWRSLPVVVSDCAPLQRIVTESGCGLVYTSGNSLQLSKQLLLIYKDRALAAEFGRRGKQAVMEKYNWDNAANALISIYRDIEN